MNELDFSKKVKELVRDYTNEHLDKTDNRQITIDDVFIVWQCKTLQNNKALASTTLFDGMYYEITFNGDKNEIYFDAYKKWENKKIELDQFKLMQVKVGYKVIMKNLILKIFEKSVMDFFFENIKM